MRNCPADVFPLTIFKERFHLIGGNHYHAVNYAHNKSIESLVSITCNFMSIHLLPLQRGPRLPAFHLKLRGAVGMGERVRAVESPGDNYGTRRNATPPPSFCPLVFDRGPLRTAMWGLSPLLGGGSCWHAATLRLLFACLIVPLSLCGGLIDGPRGRASGFWQGCRMICSQTATHVTNTHRPNQCVRHSLLGIIEGEKKIGKSIVATLQKLLLSGHMSLLQSQRDPEEGFTWRRDISSPLSVRWYRAFVYSYVSYGEHVILTQQERESVLLKLLTIQQCSGAEIESKCEMSNSCMSRHYGQMNTQRCIV